MTKNPFKLGTTSYKDFEVLSDLKWHCTKCELKSGQAKTWQVWRQNGIQLDTDEKGNYFKKMNCNKCQSKTIYRKLKSLELTEETYSRSGLPQKLIVRIKNILHNVEAVFLNERPPKELEVDHRFPQIRWGENEALNRAEMSEVEIREKFMLLTRSNNLLKSRYCEKCFKTGIRGSFPGINFWFTGKKVWDSKIDKHDQKGCEGCFWNNPEKWREEINKIVSK